MRVVRGGHRCLGADVSYGFLLMLWLLVVASLDSATASLGSFSGHPTRFIVVGCGRSGTTLLVTSLGENPAIMSHREVFPNGGISMGRLDTKVWPLLAHPHSNDTCDQSQYSPYCRPSQQGHSWIHELQEMSPTELTHTLWRNVRSDTRAVGFKLLKDRLPLEQAERLLKDTTIKKVVILRQDVLARLFSLMAARKTGSWKHAHYAAHLRVDPEDAVQHVAADLKWYAFLKQRLEGQDTQVVTYEQLTSDFAAVMERLSVWLGAEPGFPYRESLEKQMDEPLEEAFLNVDEVKRALTAAGLPTHLDFDGIPAENEIMDPNPAPQKPRA